MSPDIKTETESRKKSRLVRELPGIIGIPIFVIILMYPFTLGGMALMPDTWKSVHPWARGVDLNENLTNCYDPVLEYGPWFEYTQACVKDGRVPHWNPYEFCGAPLYANHLIPLFYPPFFLSLLAAHPHKIIGWFQFFNLLVSGFGFYLLLRRWSIIPFISMVGSCLWLTCGAHFLPYPVWTLGTVGFPWLLWSLEGYLEKPNIRDISTGSIIVGMIFIAGYPVMVVHLTYFTFIFFICRWWMSRRVGADRIHWIKPPIVFAMIYIFGFALASVANFPAFAYSPHTVREFEGFTDKAFQAETRQLRTPAEEAGMDPFVARLGEQADIFFPVNGRGNQRAWQYGGLFIYLLGFLGILSGRRIARLLGILWLIFAMPVLIPEIYLIAIDVLPGWGVTILYPIEVINLIACILATFGIEAIFRKSPEMHDPMENPVGVAGKWIFAALVIGSIAIMILTLRNAPVINLPFLLIVADPNLLGWSAFHRFHLAAFIVLSIGAAGLVFINRKIILTRCIYAFLVIGFSAVTFWYLQPVYSPVDYQHETKFISWLADVAGSENGGSRIIRWAQLPLPFNPHKKAKSPFTPNIQMDYGIMDVCGYDSLVPSRFINYFSLIEDAFIGYRALIAFGAQGAMAHPRMRDIGIRWIITQDELPDAARDGCTLVWDDRIDSEFEGTTNSDDFMQVWEIDEPDPRAFCTKRVAYLSDPFDDPVVQIANWDAQRIPAVIVEDDRYENRSFAWPDVKNDGSPLILDGSSVRFTVDEPERVVIEVNAPDECYLVLRDGWYPEWEAYVDRIQTEIFPADSAFRAVRIPAGEHTVKFIYNPKSYKAGLIVSIITLLIVLGGYFIRRKKIDYSSGG